MKKLFVLAVLLLTAACGVKPTPVVPAGPAPTLRNPDTGQAADVILYFVINGRMLPVTRPTHGSIGVNTALALLLGGPSYAEAADGYTTMLPPAGGGPITLAPDPPPTITLPFPVARLSPIAINQLVCTAFAAMAAENTAIPDSVITLAGTDAKLPAQTCQAL